MLQQPNRRGRRRTDSLRRQGYSDQQISEMPERGGDPLFDSVRTRQYLGGISTMTLWRWMETLGFPQADYVIGKRRFWRLGSIEAWLDTQEAAPASNVGAEAATQPVSATPPSKALRKARAAPLVSRRAARPNAATGPPAMSAAAE
jgi:predicted DNA-binding transcriptional regulator AlpA